MHVFPKKRKRLGNESINWAKLINPVLIVANPLICWAKIQTVHSPFFMSMVRGNLRASLQNTSWLKVNAWSQSKKCFYEILCSVHSAKFNSLYADWITPFIFDPSICKTFDLAQWRRFRSQIIIKISSCNQCLKVAFKRIYSNIYSLELESGNGWCFEKLAEFREFSKETKSVLRLEEIYFYAVRG